MLQQFRSISAMMIALSILALASGCNTSAESQTASGSGAPSAASTAMAGQDPFAAIEEIPVSDTLDGLSKINSLIKTFKQAVESDDTEVSHRTAVELVGIWKAIEVELKAADPRKFENIPGELSALVEKAGSEKNKDELVDISYRLYQTFRDLKKEMEATDVQDELLLDEDVQEETTP